MCCHNAPNCQNWFAIPRSLYRAQKPLKPGNTKRIRKSHEIPHPGSGQTRKNTEKIRKRPENDHFGIFLYFFRIFGARPGVGDFVTFSYFLRISGLEEFLSSIPGTRNRKPILTLQALLPLVAFEQADSSQKHQRSQLHISGPWRDVWRTGMGNPNLSVLKRCVPKTLAFVFGLRLRSKTRCFKTRVLGRRLPNGKPQGRFAI